MSEDTKVRPALTLDVACGAVRDGIVKTLITRSSYWMDAAERKNKLRIGFEATPMGGLVVDVPVEGVKEGDPLTIEQLSEYLTIGLKALFDPVDVFVETSNSDF
jgi:hypothetical protein